MDILSVGARGPGLAAGSDFVSPRACTTWGTHYRKRLSCFCKFYQKIEPQESITRTLPGSWKAGERPLSFPHFTVNPLVRSQGRDLKGQEIQLGV